MQKLVLLPEMPIDYMPKLEYDACELLIKWFWPGKDDLIDAKCYERRGMALKAETIRSTS